MAPLGTILPTVESLRRADAHADAVADRNRLLGDRLFSGCERRTVGGEVRWYSAADQYAVVDRHGTPRRFRVEADGDHAER